VEFEWDETKRRQGIKKHGVDVLYAAQIFESEVFTHTDERLDYGEERLISVGMAGDECFVVVHNQAR